MILQKKRVIFIEKFQITLKKGSMFANSNDDHTLKVKETSIEWFNAFIMNEKL